MSKADQDRVLEIANREIESALKGVGGWNKQYVKGEVEVHFNMVENAGKVLKYTKGVSQLSISPSTAAELVTDFDFMQFWDKQFDRGHIVQDFKESENERKIVYMRYKAPWPVSQRDFVNVSEIRHRENNQEGGGNSENNGSNNVGVRVLATSFSHKDAPDVSGIVRADLMYGGWEFISSSSSSSSCKATYITAMNPKGTLPTWLVNQVANDTPMCLAAIRDFIKAHPDKVEVLKNRACEKRRTRDDRRKKELLAKKKAQQQEEQEQAADNAAAAAVLQVPSPSSSSICDKKQEIEATEEKLQSDTVTTKSSAGAGTGDDNEKDKRISSRARKALINGDGDISSRSSSSSGKKDNVFYLAIICVLATLLLGHVLYSVAYTVESSSSSSSSSFLWEETMIAGGLFSLGLMLVVGQLPVVVTNEALMVTMALPNVIFFSLLTLIPPSQRIALGYAALQFCQGGGGRCYPVLNQRFVSSFGKKHDSVLGMFLGLSNGREEEGGGGMVVSRQSNVEVTMYLLLVVYIMSIVGTAVMMVLVSEAINWRKRRKNKMNKSTKLKMTPAKSPRSPMEALVQGEILRRGVGNKQQRINGPDSSNVSSSNDDGSLPSSSSTTLRHRRGGRSSRIKSDNNNAKGGGGHGNNGGLAATSSSNEANDIMRFTLNDDDDDNKEVPRARVGRASSQPPGIRDLTDIKHGGRAKYIFHRTKYGGGGSIATSTSHKSSAGGAALYNTYTEDMMKTAWVGRGGEQSSLNTDSDNSITTPPSSSASKKKATSTVSHSSLDDGKEHESKKSVGLKQRFTAAIFGDNPVSTPAPSKQIEGTSKHRRIQTMKPSRRLLVRIVGSKIRSDVFGKHVRYICEVMRGAHVFRVQRRYSEFFQLHTALSQKFGSAKMAAFRFPPKTGLFTYTSDWFQEQRRTGLNEYLVRCLSDSEICGTKEGYSMLYRFFLPTQRSASNADLTRGMQ